MLQFTYFPEVWLNFKGQNKFCQAELELESVPNYNYGKYVVLNL